MTATVLWIAVIVASLASVALKWLGYQVPPQLLERPVIARVTGLLPIALLGALLATQTLTSGQAIVLDARVLGVAVAALLLWRRAPFLLVVIAGAAVTALLRLAGMP
ncbi:AzlD domain-containing protein [Brachybacterium nesterenkovii]|uniref:Putative membrane protein n=1 Tax=Brachybacterium nesterenkovii TaxID=47847 RepID=A0A1X6WZ69_9MICO|nr:AzlD domain-containing protein [Brachybacterium nesterenkovii]SLM91167.1 putative membrane protein [Brachybacterium nesterenkovii]